MLQGETYSSCMRMLWKQSSVFVCVCQAPIRLYLGPLCLVAAHSPSHPLDGASTPTHCPLPVSPPCSSYYMYIHIRINLGPGDFPPQTMDQGSGRGRGLGRLLAGVLAWNKIGFFSAPQTSRVRPDAFVHEGERPD